ncbi:MAG: thiol peroxidase [Bacteroidales bacterium]
MKDITSIETKNVFAAKGNPLTLLGRQINVGDTAPEIVASDISVKDVKLSDFKGKVVVLSVFPSIDTTVCATQTRTFNKKATEFSPEVVVLTISKDLPFALGRFCAAEGINNIHTLSDYKYSRFGLEYGFLVKENRLLARGVVIIDKKGVVRYKEITKDIVVEPDYDKAIEVIKQLV